MKALKWIDKNFEIVIMSVLVVGICLVMFLQVIMRYFFNNALEWPEELGRYMFIWFSALGMGYGIRNKNHLKIDLIGNIVPKPVKVIFKIIALALEIFLSVMLIIGGPEQMNRVAATNQLSVAMRMPMQVVYVSMFVGGILMLIRIVEVEIMDLIEAGKKKKEVKEGE